MSNKSFVTTVLLLLLTVIGVVVLGLRETPKVVNTNLENLPMTIGSYKGVEDSFSDGVYRELNADKHVYRHYTDPQGNRVDLYIGYYGTAKGGRTGHNPYACLPSSGWAILEAASVEINKKEVSAKIKNYRVNYLLAAKDDSYETVFHWYQSDKDKILATGIQQNIQRFFGRLFYNRNDGAFVRISTPSNSDNVAESKARCKAFTEQLLDLLPLYWPEEQ